MLAADLRPCHDVYEMCAGWAHNLDTKFQENPFSRSLVIVCKKEYFLWPLTDSSTVSAETRDPERQTRNSGSKIRKTSDRTHRGPERQLTHKPR